MDVIHYGRETGDGTGGLEETAGEYEPRCRLECVYV